MKIKNLALLGIGALGTLCSFVGGAGVACYALASKFSSTQLAYYNLPFLRKEEAEDVLDAMTHVVAQTGMVSIAECYALAKFPHADHDDFLYGWTDLSDAHVVEQYVAGKVQGYILVLPRATKLEGKQSS